MTYVRRTARPGVAEALMDGSRLPDFTMPTAISRRPRLTRWHAAICSGP